MLNRLAEPTTPAGLGSLPEVDFLRTVWVQQYELRALFVSTEVNLCHAARWLAGVRPKPRQNRLALALMAS